MSNNDKENDDELKDKHTITITIGYFTSGCTICPCTRYSCDRNSQHEHIRLYIWPLRGTECVAGNAHC